MKTRDIKCKKTVTYTFFIPSDDENADADEDERSYYSLEIQELVCNAFYYTFGDSDKNGTFRTGENGHMRAFYDVEDDVYELRHKPEISGFENFDFRLVEPSSTGADFSYRTNKVQLYYKGTRLLLI